jgi:flavin reductase (DIM6/NTAB) family NADH-FMN oxidoreductase RutF
MLRTDIPMDALSILPVHLFHRKWFLLSAGDFRAGDWNCMTVSWGGLGNMWNKPFALVVVRPTRYTARFMEKWPSFTLSAFPEIHRRKLSYCGSHSGREGDKAKAAGFTAVASRLVSAPSFEQAELILECRKSYFSDMDPGHFIDPSTEGHYPAKDYHRLYFGEIVAVSGTAEYRRDAAVAEATDGASE